MKLMLKKPSDIRAASAETLRRWLDELQAMSDKGDVRQEVYFTFVKITTELERRKLRLRGKPELLIPRRALYDMPVSDLRQRYAYLEFISPRTELQENTLQALRGELERRAELAKKVYAKRKAARRAVHTDRVLSPLWRELGGAASPEPAVLCGAGSDVSAADAERHATAQ